MGKRKIGPVSKKIKDLCHGLSGGQISKNDFKKGIQGIIDEYGESGYILQGIGIAIQKWYKGNEQVWRLVDETDSRIRKQFENYVEKMKG